MNAEKQDELLMQISKDVAEIKVKLLADYKALYGNGHPGLLSRHETLERRVVAIETQHSMEHTHTGAIAIVIGFIVNAAIAIYGVFKN